MCEESTQLDEMRKKLLDIQLHFDQEKRMRLKFEDRSRALEAKLQKLSSHVLDKEAVVIHHFGYLTGFIPPSLFLPLSSSLCPVTTSLTPLSLSLHILSILYSYTFVFYSLPLSLSLSSPTLFILHSYVSLHHLTFLFCVSMVRVISFSDSNPVTVSTLVSIVTCSFARSCFSRKTGNETALPVGCGDTCL